MDGLAEVLGRRRNQENCLKVLVVFRDEVALCERGNLCFTTL
jgi:hypothetical protein